MLEAFQSPQEELSSKKLSPGFGSDHQNFSDQNSNASKVPSKKASDGHKKHSHSHRKHDVGPRSTSDQYSDLPRMSSTKPKKHADKTNLNTIQTLLIIGK